MADTPDNIDIPTTDTVADTIEPPDHVGFFQSISFKIVIIFFAASVLMISGTVAISIYTAKDTMQTVYSNYTQNVAEAAADGLIGLFSGGDAAKTSDFIAKSEMTYVDELKSDPAGKRQKISNHFVDALGSIKLDGVEGSYAYYVSADGLMIFHPTTEKIGEPVENAAVKGLVQKLSNGETPDSIGNGSVIYEFKGEDKYAGYAFTPAGNMVIVTGDYDKVMAPVNHMTRLLSIMSIVMIIAALVIVYVIVMIIMRPIKGISAIVISSARFDFRHHPDSDKLIKRSDEIGLLAKEMRYMRDNLREIVAKIQDAANRITEDVDALFSTTGDVSTMCSDNSATTEELAAAMEETSAAADTINSSLGGMQDNAGNIDKLTKDGTDMSEEVMQRAAELSRTTHTASDKTKNIYNSVRERSDEAIKNSKAVEKIEVLTNTIMAISSQTSLLALNASIEAARAGDAGKGFAVVASEIGNLAGQTSSAVSNIEEIVGEVRNAVSMMADCLEDTTSFLEKTVLSDYDQFQKVSEQYKGDADRFKDSMNDIKKGMSNLTTSIDTIVKSISDITITVSESAHGVSDVADKTTDIVSGAGDISEKVTDCEDYVHMLDDIVDMFKIQ